MADIEQRELDAYRDEIVGDVGKMIEKYRRIFDWDVPDIDQNAADALILSAVRKALDAVEYTLQTGKNIRP